MDSTKWKIRLALLAVCFLLLSRSVSLMAVPGTERTPLSGDVAQMPGYELNNGRRHDLAESNNEHLTSQGIKDRGNRPLSGNFLESKRNEASNNDPLESRNTLDGNGSHHDRSGNREVPVELDRNSLMRNNSKRYEVGRNNDHLEPGNVVHTNNSLHGRYGNPEEHVELERDSGTGNQVEPEITGTRMNSNSQLVPGPTPNIPDYHTNQNQQAGYIPDGSHRNENQGSQSNIDGQTHARAENNSVSSNGQLAPGEIPIITGNQANERLQPGYRGNGHESIETGETQHNTNTHEHGNLAPGEIPEIPGIHGDQNERLQPGFQGNRNEETDHEETQNNNHNNENGHIVPGAIPNIPGFHGNHGLRRNESEPVRPVPGPEPVEPPTVRENASEIQSGGNNSEIELTTVKPIQLPPTDHVETTRHHTEIIQQITPSPSWSAITDQGETIHGQVTPPALLSSYSEMYGVESLGLHTNLPSASHQMLIVSASAQLLLDSSTLYTDSVDMPQFTSVNMCDNSCSQRNRMTVSELLGSSAVISPSSVSMQTDSSLSWKNDDKLAHKNEKSSGFSLETVSATQSFELISSAITTPQSVESVSSSSTARSQNIISPTDSAQSVSSTINTAQSVESFSSTTGTTQSVESISHSITSPTVERFTSSHHVPTGRPVLSSTSSATPMTTSSHRPPSSTSHRPPSSTSQRPPSSTSQRSGFTTWLHHLTGEVVSLPSVSHEIIIEENTTLSRVTLPQTTPKPDNQTQSNNSSVAITTQKKKEKTFQPTMSFLSTILHRNVTRSPLEAATTVTVPRQTTLTRTVNHSTSRNFNIQSTRNTLQPVSEQKRTKPRIIVTSTSTPATRNVTIRNNDSRVSTVTRTVPTTAAPAVLTTTTSVNHSTQPTHSASSNRSFLTTLIHHRSPSPGVTLPRETTLGVVSSTSNTRTRRETIKQMTTLKRSTFLPYITRTSSLFSHSTPSSTSAPLQPASAVPTAASLHTSRHIITPSRVSLIPGERSTRKSYPTPMHRPPVFATVKLRMTWNDFCDNEGTFRMELVDIFHRHARRDVKTTQIMFVNINIPDCVNIMSPADLSEHIDLKMYLVDVQGRYDSVLTIACCEVIETGFNANKQSYFRDKLVEVKLNQPLQMVTPPIDREGLVTEPGIIIAIVIASVGGVCCITLIMLQVIIRRRYAKKSQSCPTSSRQCSFTSTDSIALGSVNKARPHSGILNPGLDPTSLVEPSVPINLTSLANKCLDVISLYEEFLMIPNYTPRLSTVPIGAEDKNRYANVIPIPHTRVKLKKLGGQHVSDYINANYITGYMDDKRAYIATQAPMMNTVPDFWRMVWEQQCRVIVMLTAMDEQGHPKCAPYWPDSENDPLKRYGDYLITLKKKDVYQEYTVSSLQLKDIDNNLVREIKQFWYTCWPVHGIPEPISLVKFVLDTRPYYEDSGAPLIVHCSPGTGRTGTLITLDICMRQFENKRLVDVMGCVHQMRQERAGVIQTKEQYALIHMALNEYACVLTSPAISAASSSATLQTMH